MSDAMKPFIKAVGTGPRSNRHLSRDEAREALSLILSGEATPGQAAAYFIGSRIQGEDPEELLGYIDAIRAGARTLAPKVDNLVDLGTPYDGRRDALYVTVAASLVAAAAGTPQLLHGSGSMPPKRGVPLSAVLEALKIPTRLPRQAVEAQIERLGFAYIDARDAAPEVYALAELLEEIGLRTLLSTVEKLYDLGSAPHHIIGVTHAPYIERFIGAMQGMGWARSLLVQGIEGSEDIGTSHGTRIIVVTPTSTEEIQVRAADLGLQIAGAEELSVGDDPGRHAEVIRAVLERNGDPAIRDVVLLNAALRIWTATNDPLLPQSLDHARQTLESGAPLETLAALRASSPPG